MTCRPAGYRVKAVLPAADKERHLIECFFNKIKHDRRIFSRFEKLARHYMGILRVVSALVWWR